MSGPDAREDRFRCLYAEHFNAVLGFALRRTDRPEDAADVTADTFLVAWRRLDHAPPGGEVRPWLYGVARRVLANQRRGDGRRAALGERLRDQLTRAVGQPTPATDTPELAHCDEVVLDEQQPGDVVQEERYQRPPRPVLITADGWDVDGVYNMDLDWVGPGDAEVHVTWVQTDSADPFAYDRYDRTGDRIDILGVTGRLTGFVQEGKDYQVLLTSPVDDGGPGLLLETSSLGPAEFRALVRSLEWVDLAEYDAVVKPAVG